MELISLNTNGIRDGRKRRSLFNWLKKFHKAQDKIVFLQETHTDENNEADWTEDWGHKNIIFSHGSSRSRGVAVILPESYNYTINSKEIDSEGRYIALNLTVDETQFFLINSYAPTADLPEQQLQWLQKIQKILEEVSDIGGDSLQSMRSYPKDGKCHSLCDFFPSEEL